VSFGGVYPKCCFCGQDMQPAINQDVYFCSKNDHWFAMTGQAWMMIHGNKTVDYADNDWKTDVVGGRRG
jgi:hypothetical protein